MDVNKFLGEHSQSYQTEREGIHRVEKPEENTFA